MKKLTATIFVALLTAVSTGAAKADIASSGYVDEKVGVVSATVATKADKSAVDTLSGKVTANEGDITTLQSQMAGKANSDDVYTKTDADGKFQVQTNLVPSAGYEAAKTDDTKYPSVKAVDEAIVKATQGIASESAVEDLQNKVGTATLETTAQDLSAAVNELDTGVTELETEVANKQNANMGAEAANKIVTTDGTGNITTSDTIANTQVSGLGALATKSTVTGTDIAADAAIAKTQLATNVQTSLGLADTSVQPAAINDMLTKTAASTTYETITNAAATYIPKPGTNCTEDGAKCVLVTNGTEFAWEDIARGASEGSQP